MEQPASPKKKLKSPVIDPTANINIKTSVTCANVPEGLFDATAVKKHFSKFGRVQKIRLFPKKQMCIIEYDQPISAERAVLNAGAFDGFMFDVTRTKARTRRRSRKEEDPDWVPDSDVEAELSAMGATPIYRVSRQKPMDIENSDVNKFKHVKQPLKQTPVKPKLPVKTKTPTRTVSAQPSASGRESPVLVATVQTTMTTAEAAAELHQLRSRVSLTPDEQWRTLDARDRILRAWGGAGSRVKIGGATIGTCPDMCPEKELLHRQAEHQVMTLETVPGSDGQLEPWRAVKQYSRSSADQEIPMCYELRPAIVLLRTCAYLLHDIADTKRQVALADWFHFMWDRLRGIRKDIAQQALCCADSIYLMEMCARFHAHCAARLADLEHTQFDQKLNTDNLTKCLQTLKHMYADVTFDLKPNEPEFRGYIALLNLGDSNFWWEIQQLPLQIQKSKPIAFAIKIFNALDNNNYVRFFRLVKEEATYLQACILLRYFNDVRARALARIVKAYAPRGGSRFPVDDLMNTLHFETVESMRSFITHYGLRFGKDESDLCVILDRNQFIEDSDPYPIARAVTLIESKRKSSVGEVIAGGPLPNYDYSHQTLYCSFVNGVLKESALTAEDQGYDTKNDSNKDVQSLKQEIKRLSQGGRAYVAPEAAETKSNTFVKPNTRTLSPGKSSVISTQVFTSSSKNTELNRSFSFKPAIPVAPTEIIKISPEKIFGASTKNTFSFSKPQNTVTNNLFADKEITTFPKTNAGSGLFSSKVPQDNFFGKINNQDPVQNSNLFKKPNETNAFKRPEAGVSLFRQTPVEKSDTNRNLFSGQNVFGSSNIFAKVKEESTNDKKPDIFTKTVNAQDDTDSKKPSNIFGSFTKPNVFSESNKVFTKTEETKSIFHSNGDVSPGTLFKTANNAEGKTYSIFQSKNKVPSVADNIFNSVKAPQSSVYEFDQADDKEEQLKQQRINEERIKEELERQKQQKLKEEEERKQLELKRQEAERRKEEERKKQEELKRLEEIRKREEERKQEELRKKLEEERKAELRRKAEEAERKFRERVEKESSEVTEELIIEISDESVTYILKEEKENFENLMSYAKTFTEEMCTDVSNEIISVEMKAEKFWTEKVMKKWFYIWRKQLLRNSKRRCLLEDTPVWLPDKTPLEEAASLRRLVENEALENMAAIHRGYIFKGELKQWPKPEAYNIMEIIRSPLLRRMKQIGYPYDKCFFWKVTLVSPGDMKWMCRKIEIEKWLLNAFSDNKKHETSDSLIRVEKQSWNHLMDFAISISLTSPDRKKYCAEAIEGTNGILFYTTESDHNFINTIEETLKQKYLYQMVPVTVIMPKAQDVSKQMAVEQILNTYVNNNVISAFKILSIDSQDICDSLNTVTRSALKWMAKKYPQVPPIEIDFLKSLCERYLGNEIWYRLKSATDARVNFVLKDLQKLVDCYNAAVDKLTEVITNEDLFNWPSFPLEFHDYLDHSTPYPKPYEFIPTSARNSNNISAIKDVMNKLKLPQPVLPFQPVDVVSLQSQMRNYCNQIEWFEDTETVVCKVVAKLPDQFSDLEMSCEQFRPYFEQYDLIDFLNVLIYEKINGLGNFDNRFAIYEKSALEEFRNIHWLYEIEILSKMKHKVLTYDDDLDMFIKAKRRKIALDSMEHLMLENNDCTMVEENIKAANESISRYSDCKDTIRQLEEQIDLERKKSMDLENMLKSALSNV